VLDRAKGAAADSDQALRGQVALWWAIAWSADEAKRREGLNQADELLPSENALRPLLALWGARTWWRSDPNRALGFLESITKPPADWVCEIAVLRARSFKQLGRVDDAFTVLDSLVADAGSGRTDQHAMVACMRAELLLDAGQPQRALDALTDVRDTARADESLVDWFLKLQTDAANALGERDLLEDALAGMVERDASMKPFADVAHADTLFLRGDLPGCFAVFRSLEEPQDPSNPLAWVVAASARQLSNRSDVDAALDRAIELDPEAVEAPLVRRTRAFSAAGRGDVDAVEAYYGKLAAGTPDDRVMYHYCRAAALRQAGRRLEAIEEFESVEALSAETTSQVSATVRAQALAEKAILLLTSQKITEADKAVTKAEAAVADLPSNGLPALLTHLARGLLHMSRGEHNDADEALAAADAIAGTLPDQTGFSFAVEYLRGVNWMVAGAGAEEDALYWLTKAVDHRPADPDALEALGRVYLALDDPAKALDAFVTAVAGTSDPGPIASLLRDKATAQRQLGHLEAAVDTSREATTREPAEPRNWLSLGASQLELGRNNAAVSAFRRGWRLRPWPPDEIAAQLVLGLTKALLDDDRADDALDVLNEAKARQLARAEPLIELNHAVALLRLQRDDDAVEALKRANRPATANQVKASHSGRESWVGFWFGSHTSVARRIAGALLVIAALLALFPAIVNPEEASWLGWTATGNVRPLVPLAAIGLLFLLPVVTGIKFGNVEIDLPVPATPTVIDLQAVSWNAIEQKIRAISAAPVIAAPAQTTPHPELPKMS